MPDHMSQIAKSELFDSLSADDLSKILPVCSGYEADEEGILFAEGGNASHPYCHKLREWPTTFYWR